MRRQAEILRSLLVALALATAVPSLVRAEDPFQSAPGPVMPQPRAHPRASPPLEAAPAAPIPAPIAPAPMRADTTYHRRARSGVAEVVIGERANDPNCGARPIDMRVVEPPRNGTAVIRDEISPIPATGRYGDNSAACIGRLIATKSIYYQSSPGFRGADRLVYLISVGGGEWKRIEVEITVE
jgi:hypothetical protein